MYNVLNNKILRAGLFERVSTEEQAKYGYSIRDQVEALEEYCKKNKIKIPSHKTLICTRAKIISALPPCFSARSRHADSVT